MSVSKLYNLNERKKSFINKIITIYLWGFSITLILFFIDEMIITFTNNFSSVIEILGSFFIESALIFVLLFMIIFHRMYGIKEKIFNKNKISFVLNKYLRILFLLFFLFVIPLVLLFLFFLTRNIYILIYYFFVSLSSIFPLLLIFLFVTMYNVGTNLKQRVAWKNFGINIIFFTLIFLYFHVIIKILYNNL